MEDNSSSGDEGLTYERAGVSIEAQDAAIELIKPLAASTHTPSVLAGVGGFAAAFEADFAGYQNPVLVSSTDGVGTKVKLAARFDAWEEVGWDCVAVCVNDLVTTGARPLFVLDYIACHRLEPAVVERIVTGIRDACLECGCALLGGELAEMRDVYAKGEADLAGFAVGVVDGQRRIDGSTVVSGDVVLGFPSSGIHANGLTLARKVFAGLSDAEWRAHNEELGCSLASELLRPTIIYYRWLQELAAAEIEIKALAHISGGGLPGNAARMLPPGLDVRIVRSAIPVHPIFKLIARTGPVGESEMWRTFNMGLGLTLVLAPEQAEAALELPQFQRTLHRVGEIAPGTGRVVLL